MYLSDMRPNHYTGLDHPGDHPRRYVHTLASLKLESQNLSETSSGGAGPVAGGPDPDCAVSNPKTLFFPTRVRWGRGREHRTAGHKSVCCAMEEMKNDEVRMGAMNNATSGTAMRLRIGRPSAIPVFRRFPTTRGSQTFAGKLKASVPF
ncbi:hypothetical protein VOLCADRAFT_92408 [Volvox carteri f. nagariensis]|uniref:Uncharacterized protein n=1 Tax=Volvox carteri f. nagariensis TaxID=3068 RepID=D8TZL0_VOLCA|nr:uncharacterized protein VOLCADRAFT_92408 [Volvox carteri f. nagariensis]EFJ47032.1 hypothetical protein VOLCADRAFT_92408 [Volvox carteri f. nagariensis]|eukprot:XP_002951927.1 hypothetical protein VOLCADRAFT_92408 [Volvox carteri f. nagariensis]